MPKIFTGGYRLADPVEDAEVGEVPDNFCDAYIAMRQRAERSVGVTKWNVEEKQRTNERLAAMGRSESPEQQAKILDSQIRKVERDILIDGVLEQINSPKSGK